MKFGHFLFNFLFRFWYPWVEFTLKKMKILNTHQEVTVPEVRLLKPMTLIRKTLATVLKIPAISWYVKISYYSEKKVLYFCHRIYSSEFSLIEVKF